MFPSFRDIQAMGFLRGDEREVCNPCISAAF
jgi:hypothetical protein